MARFAVEEDAPKSTSRFQVEDETPTPKADAPAPSRFAVEEEGQFPAGSPSARTPAIVRDAPSFDEAFPPTDGKSDAFNKIEGIANTIVGSVVKPIEYVTEKYEKYVAGPVRRSLFKEDPLVTLDRQHREKSAILEATDASPGAKLWEDVKHAGKSLAVGVLADPLAVLGGSLGAGRGAKPPLADPSLHPQTWQGPPLRPVWQGPVMQEFQGPDLGLRATSVDLTALNKPKPTSPLPSITELADDSRYAPDTSQAGVFSEDMLTAPMRRSPDSIAGRPEPLMPTARDISDPITRRNMDAYSTEMTTEFEKPGFLRTAEEKVQDKNPLRTAEEQVSATEPKQARDYERARRELIAAEEERIAARQRTKVMLAGQRDALIKSANEAAPPPPRHEYQGPQRPEDAFFGPPAPRTRFQSSEQAAFTHDTDGNIVISDGAFPGGRSRFVTRALDTLGQTGETGTALKSIYYGMDDVARQQTATNFADWVRAAQTIYPKNSRPGIFRDPRREWSYKDYINIPDKEYEAAFDLWYSNGQDLRSYEKLPRDAQIRVDSAFDLWKIATGRASSDPGVRRLTIRNSVTGQETPMGEPGAFIPHQYRNGVDTGKLSRTIMNRMYESYRKDNPAGMSFNDFRETYVKRASGYEQVIGENGKAKWIQTPVERRFLGVEEARLFDAGEVAKEEGKSILQVMKEHGLETDIAKMQLRYNLGAYHRGQIKLNEEKIARLQANWRQEVDFDADAISWLDTLDARYKGLSMHEDIERLNQRWLQQVKSYNALTLLSRATLGAANQFFTYGLSKTSWGGLLDRVLATSTDELAHVKDMIPDSGALLSNFVQEMNRVDGFLGAASMAQLRLTGFNYLDRVQRAGAAKLGYFYAKDLGKQLVKDPTNAKVIYQLQELRLNPQEVLDSFMTEGRLSDPLAKRAMQVYADNTMGVTGVRGRPLYATGSHWSSQLALNIRGQLVSNMAEAKRMVFDAPDFMTGVDKAARLMLGAALAGTATMSIRDAITGHYGELRGSAKDIAKQIGSESTARLVDGIMYGLGTTATDATIMVLAPGDDVRGRFLSGVLGTSVTQINKAADMYTGLKKDPGRTILKNIPSPIPLDKVGEELGVIRRKERK